MDRPPAPMQNPPSSKLDRPSIANRVADELDKRRREQQSKLEEYNQCPSFVSSKYVWDLLQPSTLV